MKTAAGLAPAAISAAGFTIALTGLFSAAVIPEFEKMNHTIFAWGMITSFEAGVLVPYKKKRMSMESKYWYHRIAAITVLAEVLTLAALSVLTGEEALFISELHAAPCIYLLSAASLITLATGHTNITRLLLAITAVLILTGWIFPLTEASWDGLRYSEDIFRTALLSELMMPLYVISILPPASAKKRGETWKTRKVRI